MVNKRLTLRDFDITTSFAPMKDMGFFVNFEDAEFKNDAKEFEYTNAWYMADCSRLAYIKDKKIVRKELRKIGLNAIKFIDIDGTQCFVASNNETIIVAFRGTEMTFDEIQNNDYSDILTDVDSLPVKSTTHGLVHRGFKNAYDIVNDELTEYLVSIQTPKHTLWFTGHSLGGALATIAASIHKANGLYTFGSPRVGSWAFTKNIETPAYRVAHARDIVTRVPTPPVFWHVGEEHFITLKEEDLVDPSFFTRIVMRLGGSGFKIAFLLIKLLFLKSAFDLIVSYIHNHSPYNYSVYMWNHIK